MLRLIGISVLSVLLAITLAFNFSSTKVSADDNNANKITGSWYVNANGAPFVPHVMSFHDDHTFLIDNPEAGDSHTSDSVGVGPWKKENSNIIKGKFVEVNADRNTHQFVNNLVVTFTITINGDTFTGPAEARYYDANWNLTDGPFPATLDGTRIQFDSLP